jgi:hypothetical protein
MNKPTDKTVWYVNIVTDKEGNFLCPQLVPYKVLFGGIKEGCSLPSISVIEPTTGVRINSSLDFYHESEEDAWESIVVDLNNTLLDKESELADLQRELEILKKYQDDLDGFITQYYEDRRR